MICVHPTIAHNRATLLELQIATGLRVVLGQSYLRLVNADGTTPACKAAPRKPIAFRQPPYNGGGNAA